MNQFWIRVQQMDRRILYVVLAIGVLVPILARWKMDIHPSPEVKKAYDFIEQQPEGSTFLISIDYDAASMPEVQPMLHAMLRHLFRKNHKVLMIAHWPLGVPLGQLALEEEARRAGKVYGKDYAFLGFRPGLAAVIVNMGKDFRSAFSEDYKGTPLDSLPVARNIRNYDQIAAVIGLEAGSVGDAWVQYAQARYGVHVILGSTAVVAPDYYPYLQANQIVALIGGLKGAADYERLVGYVGTASTGMTTQSVVHLLLIGFILLGNLAYAFGRRTS